VHLAFNNLSKEMYLVLGANGHGILTRLGVVISLQAMRSAMVNFRIVRHDG
jgi:hypothetical protein